ncbi:MAG: endolytic transglycosylase MltG [Thalassotalea sp.]|nr:endolytic transglycosylase MltG [Thalassotalea sp.]
MKKFLIALLICVTSILLVANWQMQSSLDQSVTDESKLLTVTAGASMNSFSKQLQKEGYIDNRFWLRVYARLFPQKALIKAGTFEITEQDSLRSLLAKVVSGKEHQFSMTFIEGSQYKEWLKKIRALPSIKHSLPEKITGEQLSKLIGISAQNPEGWLFPDTYAYIQGTTDISLLKRAHQRMEATLAELWQQQAVDLPYDSPYEVLIMASIIEKETAVLAEQPLIAAVFINRLRKKMRLQTDPTVIYGLGERYQGDITRAHLREKTAYNTYRINGLPPTPIAMPGRSAIEAALNPADSDYLYFVSKGDGSHYFSKTLQEHNKAVRKYQLGLDE